MLLSKKIVTLFILSLLFTGSAFGQRIFFTEESTGKIRVGNLGPTSITAQADFRTGLNFPRTIEVDFANGILYYGNWGNEDIEKVSLADGSFISTVITMGAMAGFTDFEYSENAGALFATGISETPGLYVIPENNNGSGLEYTLDLGAFSNSTFACVAADDGSEKVYMGSPDEADVFRTGFADATLDFPNISATNVVAMNFDEINNVLYFVNENVNYDLWTYNVGTNTASVLYTNISSSQVMEVQVSAKLGKVYYSVFNDGIYSRNIDGSGGTVKILNATGSVFFDIEDDYTSPVFISLNPADGATLVPTAPTVVMTFDENIQRSTTAAVANEANIRILRSSDNAVHTTIDRSSANISIINNVVTISGISALELGTNYYILIGSKVFSDLSKNNFSGISLPTGWNFQTVPPVVITAPSQPACIAAFTDLPNIVITESVPSNIKTGANQTLTFTPSAAGYSFQAGTGSVSFIAARNITAATISVLANSITVTYTATAESALDAITISGIKVTAASISSPTVNLIRTGGTGAIDGLSTNAIVATFTPQGIPSAPPITYSSGNNLCIGADVSGEVVSTIGTSLTWYSDAALTNEVVALVGSGSITGPEMGLSSATANTVTLYVTETINNCTSPAATAAMTIIDGPTSILTTKTDQTSCVSSNGSITVTGVGGGGTTGYTYDWADAALNSLGVSTLTLPNVGPGTYNLRVTSDATGCSSYAAPVTLIDNVVSPIIVFAITPNTSCAGTNGSLTATIQNQIGPLTDYTFTWRNGSLATSPVNNSSTTSLLNNLAPGFYGVTILHIPTQCESFLSAEIINSSIPPTSTPPAVIACETTAGGGTASINLTLYNNTITGGDANLSVAWFFSGSPVTTVTATNGGTYEYRVTDLTSGCESIELTNVTVESQPSAANAGTDQSACGSSALLAANTPVNGTGTWSVVSGTGGSFGTATNPASAFNGIAGNTYTLRWTVSNGTCTASADEVVITFEAAPTAANAGVDQSICTTTGTLAGNTAAVGTGTWSIISGTGGTISNPSSSTSPFSGTAGSTYVLRWTITNGSCTPSTDDVTITILDLPTVSNAGPDQNRCATDVTLAANTPTSGTGLWSIQSGVGGSLGAPTSPTSTFTGVSGATYTLRWTISNGACTPSTDDVIITFEAAPTAANAGTDQSICATTATLAGNTPAIGTGSWTVISGAGGTIASPTSNTSTFGGNAGSTYVLRWTISNGACTPTTDDVSITFINQPTVASAGPDQANCGDVAVLQGNTPVIGTGLWSIISGTGGSFATPSSPTSSFTGTPGSSYTLRWTTTNSTCPASTDDVIIQFIPAPSIASAGSDQQICGNTVTLAANVPVAGTGAWSVVSGTGGSVANNGSPTSGFTGAAGGTYTLRWTISNGSCPVSTDDVSVSFIAPPTIANAGIDQTVCTTTATLAANSPAVGTGNWTVISGAGGAINTPASNASTFTGLPGTTYILRWSTTNGICTASTDDVSVAFVSPPTTASAGTDQAICVPTVALSANTPTSGSGTWSVISGSGGNFSSPTSPNSSFIGTAGNSYTLRWTIARTGCNSTTDDVTIQINSLPAGSGVISNVTAACEGQSKTLNVSGFTNATGFSWQVPSGVNIQSENGSSITILTAGSGGTISVTPTNSCGNGTPASASLTILPLPVVQIILPAASPLPGDPVVFAYSTSSSVQSQEWSFGDNGTATDPAPEYAYAAGGDYQVSISATDNNGCIGTANEPFTVLPEPVLDDDAIKNVITANGDEKNRYLHIRDLDRHPENEVRFLDRWGVEVFRADNYQNNWDARSGNGQFLPAGQYICVVRLKESGKVFSRTVSIIKGR